MNPDDFIRRLAQALHVSGSPAHELEQWMAKVGAPLNLRVQGFSLPTMIGLTIDPMDGSVPRVHLLRQPASDYNMLRLMALEELIGGLDGPDKLAAADKQLQDIMATPAPWRGAGFLACGFLLSASVARLFGGGWVEMLCGGVVGLLFVAGYVFFSRWPRMGPILPFVLCTLASLATYGLCRVFPGQTPFITLLSGIVLLLPGFTLTIALGELATQNLMAGAGRLAGAFILMVMMGFGVGMGGVVNGLFIHAGATGTAPPPPDWTVWPCVALLGVSLLAVLQAPLRWAHVAVGACLLAFAVSSAVSPAVGGVAGAFVAAFVVAVAGNLYQRLTGKPAMLVQIPGLITLVPGSVGFRGLHALMEQDSIAGLNTLMVMVLTGTALAVGTLMANALSAALDGSGMGAGCKLSQRHAPRH